MTSTPPTFRHAGHGHSHALVLAHSDASSMRLRPHQARHEEADSGHSLKTPQSIDCLHALALPRYSPRLNPIEQVWNQLKAPLKRELPHRHRRRERATRAGRQLGAVFIQQTVVCLLIHIINALSFATPLLLARARACSLVLTVTCHFLPLCLPSSQRLAKKRPSCVSALSSVLSSCLVVLVGVVLLWWWLSRRMSCRAPVTDRRVMGVRATTCVPAKDL